MNRTLLIVFDGSACSAKACSCGSWSNPYGNNDAFCREMAMITVTTEAFAADCLTLLDKVHATNEVIIITKDGQPIARLEAIGKKRDLFGAMKGSVYYEGDIISPIDVEWNVLKDD